MPQPESPAGPTPERSPSALRRVGIVALGIATIGSLIAALAPWLGGSWWVLDLAANFQRHAAIALTSLALISAFRRRPIALIAATAGLGLIAGTFWRAPISAQASAAPAQTAAAPASIPMTVLWFNVLSRNTEHDALIRLIRLNDPDIIALAEVSPAWIAALDLGLDGWPHRVLRPRRDNFGMALFSRFPLEDVSVTQETAIQVPLIRALIAHESAPFTLIAAHALPPISGEWTADRNALLARLGTLPTTLPGPAVLAGDFNITPASSPFRVLNSRWHDTETAATLSRAPTWPDAFGALGIPIDHVLTTAEIGVTSRRVIGGLGSDHRAIIVGLTVPKSGPRPD